MLVSTQRRTLSEIHGEMASHPAATLAAGLSTKLYVGLLGLWAVNFGEFIKPLPVPSFIFNCSLWTVIPATGKRD